MNKHIDEVIHAIVSRITNVARLWSRNSARDNSEDWTKIVKIRDISEHSASKNSSVSLELAREQSLAPALRSGWMKRKYGGQKLLRFLGQCINIKITHLCTERGKVCLLFIIVSKIGILLLLLLLLYSREESHQGYFLCLRSNSSERERERERDSGSFD